MSQDICQVSVIHEDRVAKANQMLPERKQVAGLAAGNASAMRCGIYV